MDIIRHLSTENDATVIFYATAIHRQQQTLTICSQFLYQLYVDDDGSLLMPNKIATSYVAEDTIVKLTLRLKQHGKIQTICMAKYFLSKIQNVSHCLR